MAGRVLRRKGFTMFGGTDPAGESLYTVEDETGEYRGQVGTYKATMERRSPGKRYVNARWQATRWWAQREGGPVMNGRFESANAAAYWVLHR